ncbi:zinc finger BED domain-containing protein RICESLEEPER 2-like [Vicia villosa]|uniref:zinc finger BED domain-containing protein RICESLEEPER 2-like n=1 Tax=Vicia villosa TaxID=3911 RepID=UPI00273CDCAE|nr:zinc finger BED domain-containing protein RICESLEEPER 2-like [Vicia villosa]
MTDETTQSLGTTSTRAPTHRRKKSSVWTHFTPDLDLIGIARCNYCGSKLKSNNGTSSMAAHSKKCKSKRMKTTPSSKTNVASPSTMVLVKFDQEKCRKAVVDMIVEMDLPYMHADHKAFHRCLNVFQPRYIPISRCTVARDVLSLWDFEREKLKRFLSEHCRSMCLTTDGWTSCQNMSYMCITAHFIDNNWTLHKKILNFVQVLSHSGEVMANTISQCLDNWGLKNVLSVTVDNASSNDRGIENLKRRIRGAVKYVKSSPSREHKFFAFVGSRHIEYKGSVQFDCDTRWNSTYDMLKAALPLQIAFLEFEISDAKYCEELEKGSGIPTALDWEKAREVAQFLEVFKASTLRISGSTYVTNNMYLEEILGKNWCMLVGLSKKNFDKQNAEILKDKLESDLKTIFEEYNGGATSGSQSSFVEPPELVGRIGNPEYYYGIFLQSSGLKSSGVKSELTKYFKDRLEGDIPNFDILTWWMVHSSRLPILANIAREVLAIPVSTVASESAFSTGGRVLDDYRSRLTARSVEALICTEDWLGGSPSPLPTQDDIDELEKIERETPLSWNPKGKDAAIVVDNETPTQHRYTDTCNNLIKLNGVTCVGDY